MINCILTIHAGLSRKNKCCDNYELPMKDLRAIGTTSASDINMETKENVTSTHATTCSTVMDICSRHTGYFSKF